MTISRPKISVIMSVYKSDTLVNLKQACESILNQTYSNFDIYIEVDGPVSNEITFYLKSLMSDRIYVEFHNDNLGLATRLNQAINKILKKGESNYIARMDADDISRLDRFQEQIEFFNENEVHILGSDVIEFSDSSEYTYYKSMESCEIKIKENIIKKCPLNHPSVMFDIRVFSQFNLRYNDGLMNTQDYYLWVDSLSKGVRITNLNKPLLKFRVNKDFHKRRGLKKSLNEFRSRVYAMRVLSIFSLRNISYTILLFLLRLSPSHVKKLAYRYFR